MTGWRAARHALHVMEGAEGDPFDEVFALLSAEELLADLASDDGSSSDEDADDDGEDDGGRKRAAKKERKEKEKREKGEKKKRGRRGRRIDDEEEEEGPEDDEAARKRARRIIDEEAQARLDQLRAEAQEANEGKEEMKKVLRVMAEVPLVDKEAGAYTRPLLSST